MNIWFERARNTKAPLPLYLAGRRRQRGLTLMQILAENQGVFNTPSEGQTFTLTSLTNEHGLRSHAIQTKNRDFAFSLFEQALEFDNEPSFGAARGGVFFIQFIADDAECATVLAVARGGNA